MDGVGKAAGKPRADETSRPIRSPKVPRKRAANHLENSQHREDFERLLDRAVGKR